MATGATGTSSSSDSGELFFCNSHQYECIIGCDDDCYHRYLLMGKSATMYQQAILPVDQREAYNLYTRRRWYMRVKSPAVIKYQSESAIVAFNTRYGY